MILLGQVAVHLRPLFLVNKTALLCREVFTCCAWKGVLQLHSSAVVFKSIQSMSTQQSVLFSLESPLAPNVSDWNSLNTNLQLLILSSFGLLHCYFSLNVSRGMGLQGQPSHGDDPNLLLRMESPSLTLWIDHPRNSLIEHRQVTWGNRNTSPFNRTLLLWWMISQATGKLGWCPLHGQRLLKMSPCKLWPPLFILTQKGSYVEIFTITVHSASRSVLVMVQMQPISMSSQNGCQDH